MSRAAAAPIPLEDMVSRFRERPKETIPDKDMERARRTIRARLELERRSQAVVSTSEDH